MNDFYLQALEARSLLAADLSGPPPEGPAEPWSAVANLVRQDLARINHPGIDGAGQTIAVIDTGIDYTHPSLGGGLGAGFKVVGGHDFFDDDEDPIDTSGHGTGVAGVLASDPFVFEEHYYSGIAPTAKLVALRITDEPDDPAPDERVRDALQWVVDRRIEFGITVVNISFGFGHFDSDQADGPFAAQIQALTNAGVAIVAASGNGGVSDGPGVDYPAADPNAIAVGAVDSFDVITDYTERSATLDMLAPGEEIISTTLGGEYVTESGTSFAAPMIAGTVALMRQTDARLTVKESLSILRSSGIDNTDGDDEFGNVTNLGFPRLDIESALELTQARLSPLGGPGDAVGEFGNGNSIAYDAQGILHFAWFDTRDRFMKYATRNLDGTWSAIQIVDNAAHDAGQYVSLALDRNGKPAIAFFDGARGDLKFATQNGATWTIQTLDEKKSTGLYPSLAFDAQNHPMIAYYRKTSGDLRLIRFDGFNWTIEQVDTSDDVGRSVSLCLSKTGDVAMAYENTTTGHLMFSTRDDHDQWQSETVDTTQGVSFIALKFDFSNRPAISYYDATPADLKFALLADQKWSSDTIDTKGAVGLYSQLLCPNDAGDLSILYYNRPHNRLMIARGSLGNWATDELETRGGRYIATAVSPDNQFTYARYDTARRILRIHDLLPA